VTAGASAPEVLVREVIEALRRMGARDVTEVDGVVEKIVFRYRRSRGQRRAKAAEVGPASD